MSQSIYRIKKFCKISNNAVAIDGRQELEILSLAFQQFAETIYKNYQINYPKFYKMDNLSKLGFLTAEILLKNISLKEKYRADRIGIILSNKNSSLDTDVKYYEMVKKGVASPSVFVYSLPNILIGEICIRNEIKGENEFFISDKYDIPFQVNYVNNLFKNGVMDACNCGWVELLGENYESFLYLVEKNEDKNLLVHTVENIENLYKK